MAVDEHQLPPQEKPAEVGRLEDTPPGVAADGVERRGPGEDPLVAVVERPEPVADPVDDLHQTQAELRPVQGELEGAADDMRVS